MSTRPPTELLDRLNSVDARSDRPLHAQIRRVLRELIDDHFEDGQKFFTEPELIARFGASRGTVRRALADLSLDGLLDRQSARGSFVRKGSVSPSAALTVRVLLPDWNAAYFTGMLRGISAACRLQGHPMQVHFIHRDDKAVDICESIEGPPANEGVVLLQNMPQVTRGLYEALTDKGYRSVNIGTMIKEYPGPSVNMDNDAIVRLSLDHLTALGHRRIVYLVNEPEASGNVGERMLAFDQIVHDRGLSQARLFSCHTQYWEDSYTKAYEAMDEVFAQAPRPTALFAHADPGAWAALRWLADNGRKVPEQVSVMGFSDDRPSQFTYPKLTTLAQPMAEMAARAVAMLTEKPLPRRMERFSPTLVVRESTGPAPTALTSPKQELEVLGHASGTASRHPGSPVCRRRNRLGSPVSETHLRRLHRVSS